MTNPLQIVGQVVSIKNFFLKIGQYRVEIRSKVWWHVVAYVSTNKPPLQPKSRLWHKVIRKWTNGSVFGF